MWSERPNAMKMLLVAWGPRFRKLPAPFRTPRGNSAISNSQGPFRTPRAHFELPGSIPEPISSSQDSIRFALLRLDRAFALLCFAWTELLLCFAWTDEWKRSPRTLPKSPRTLPKSPRILSQSSPRGPPELAELPDLRTAAKSDQNSRACHTDDPYQWNTD